MINSSSIGNPIYAYGSTHATQRTQLNLTQLTKFYKFDNSMTV